MNGLMLVGISAQDITDTTKTASKADSTLEGVKFIYRSPASPAANPWVVSPSGLYYIKLPKEQYETRWDSSDTYTVQHKIEGYESGIPRYFSFSEYAKEKRHQQVKQIQYNLIEEGKRERQQEKGLLDFSLQIPGGQSSVFTTIFGKPEVNLRVNGSANMNVGVSIQNIDNH